MERRDFLNYAGTITLLSSIGAITSCNKESEALSFTEQLVQANDERIPDLLDRQNKNTDHSSFGGVSDKYKIFHAGHTEFFLIFRERIMCHLR